MSPPMVLSASPLFKTPPHGNGNEDVTLEQQRNMLWLRTKNRYGIASIDIAIETDTELVKKKYSEARINWTKDNFEPVK